MWKATLYFDAQDLDRIEIEAGISLDADQFQTAVQHIAMALQEAIDDPQRDLRVTTPAGKPVKYDA